MGGSPVTIYQVLAYWRDARAISRGRIGQRLWNRAVGRLLGALGRSLYK